jgi:catechol-2,3-dioxygenase
MDELLAARDRIEKAGLQVVGVTDHHIIQSIYFFDPNGLRLEITTKTAEDAEFAKAASNAHEALANWNKHKQQTSRKPA